MTNRIINHHHLLPPSPATTTARSNSSTITSARSNSSTVTTARSNSTTQACAACRYQRRKCAPDCVLAPYFPHDRQRQFQNAHKLFGVSNITKIIRNLDPQQKDEAMRTIIYQADVRAHDPVGGCYRIIRELQRQIEFSRAELQIVLHQLAFCRTHGRQNQNHHHQHQHPHQILIDGGVDCDGNLYDHGLDLDLGQNQIPDQQQEVQDDHGGEYILGEQDQIHNDVQAPVQEINSWANMNNSPPCSAICLEVKPPVAVDECDDFKPLLINAGERNEFKFEFDDINEPSEEALFNDGNEKAQLNKQEENVSYHHQQHKHKHNEDNDLKGAATLFTLTNCTSY